jgi:hypothetical protein
MYLDQGRGVEVGSLGTWTAVTPGARQIAFVQNGAPP